MIKTDNSIEHNIITSSSAAKHRYVFEPAITQPPVTIKPINRTPTTLNRQFIGTNSIIPPILPVMPVMIHNPIYSSTPTERNPTIINSIKPITSTSSIIPLITPNKPTSSIIPLMTLNKPIISTTPVSPNKPIVSTSPTKQINQITISNMLPNNSQTFVSTTKSNVNIPNIFPIRPILQPTTPKLQ